MLRLHALVLALGALRLVVDPLQALRPLLALTRAFTFEVFGDLQADAALCSIRTLMRISELGHGLAD